VDLGRIRYEPAFEMQSRLHAEVLEGRRPPTVLLLEHEPVITVSKRDTALGHLLADEARLEREGVELCRTDRGGDITYHGPGQLVAYPILPLQRFGLNLRQYVHLLEAAIIDAVGAFGVEAHRDECAIGVWVGGPPRDSESKSAEAGTTDGAATEAGGEASACSTGSAEDALACAAPAPGASGTSEDGLPGGAKLAAIGVRVRRWVSMHGLALNVTTNLDHFGMIVPCGLERPVTSLQRELGEHCPGMAEVTEALRGSLERRLLGG